MKTTTIALAFIALTGSAAFAALPDHLPSFKTSAELTQWRAEQKTKQIANPATKEAGTFYTGKPYVASSNGYVFKHRNFNPEIARWTSADPCGFPDGANNHIYAFAPTNGLDPDGLEWVFTGENKDFYDSGSYNPQGILNGSGSYYREYNLTGFNSDNEATVLTLVIKNKTSYSGYLNNDQIEVDIAVSFEIDSETGKISIVDDSEKGRSRADADVGAAVLVDYENGSTTADIKWGNKFSTSGGGITIMGNGFSMGSSQWSDELLKVIVFKTKEKE